MNQDESNQTPCLLGMEEGQMGLSSMPEGLFDKSGRCTSTKDRRVTGKILAENRGNKGACKLNGEGVAD